MSRYSKNNGKAIHSNKLSPSPPDLIMLGEAVETRFIEVLDLNLRINGSELLPPQSLDADMKFWREMRIRHKKGDFRNSDDEKLSTRRIAEWTYEVNCKLRGQPFKKLEWKD